MEACGGCDNGSPMVKLSNACGFMLLARESDCRRNSSVAAHSMWGLVQSHVAAVSVTGASQSS